jgi:ATP-binding cassette, subfamily F, member 3
VRTKIKDLLGAFMFKGDDINKKVKVLSGGEKTRLAMIKLLLEPVNLLILDEPTNHLDVDAREALVQALNAYEGAVILISHDRHMVELTADRLVLVDEGTAREYNGSMEDYIDFVLGRNQPKEAGGPKASKKDKQQAKKDREAARALQANVSDAEKAIAKYQAQIAEIDAVLAAPDSAKGELAKLTMGDLSKRRAEVADALSEAEEKWLALNEQLELV